MLDKIIVQVALALFQYIERRIAAGKIAVEADADPARLRRAGARIREWVRQQDSLHPRRESDQDRA